MTEQPSLWEFGGLTPLKLTQRTWKEIQEDELSARSAQLSYYFLLALFPLLLFLLSVMGMFAGPGTGMRAALLEYLGRILPASAGALVYKTVDEVTKASGGGKISFGLLGALWASSNGMTAITQALNICYDVKEGRPWWKRTLTAVGLTIAISVLVISALVIVLFGGKLADFAASHFGMSSVFHTGWMVVQWPLALAFMFGSFSLIYYFAPDVKDQKWYWVTPGAVVGVVLWIAVSFGMKLYLHFFNNYSATYGSLGAVIILMLWFFLTGFALLVGGELNSEIEHAAAEARRADAKAPAQKRAA